jgi:ubiquinone/menaquinone biosynthesis C-methylase UbiE
MTDTRATSAPDIDAVRRFWDARPCNIRHSPRPVGSREYFDEVEARKYFVEPHIPRFAEFERWRGLRVLEVGCGIGTDTMSFARHGASVTAVDLSERSLEVARRRAEVLGLGDRVRFYCADAERLTDVVPVEPYDLIYSFGVIHHTVNPGHALDQLRRYAGPHTTLKVMVYHAYASKVFWIVLRHGRGRLWRLSELVTRYSEAQEGCPITFVYSPASVRRLLAEHGFTTTALTVEHIFPYCVTDYRNYRYVRTWYLRWMPRGMFHWLEHRLGWHLCVTARPAEPVARVS